MAPPIKTIRDLDIQGYYEKSDRFDQLELLVESCVKSISQMRIIQNYKNGLSLMMEALPQIYDLDNTRSIYESILSITLNIFQGDRSFLMISDFTASQGENELHLLGDITEEEVRDIVKNAHFDGQKVITLADMLLAPIEDEEHKIIGILGTDPGVSPEYVQVQMMEIYIRQISSALHNSQLHRLVSTKNEELTKAYEQLNESYVEIINAMRTIVDERDIYTRGHSDRVSAIAADIAGQMKKDKHTIERIRLAGLFHDIGKPATLTVDEDGITHFYGHPAVGEEMARKILRRLRFDNDTVAVVTRLVRYHDYVNDVIPDLRIVRRAVNKIGEDIFPLLFPVKRADILAQSDYLRTEKLENLELWKKLYQEMLEKKQCVSLKTLAVTGRDLIDTGMKPGRELGEMLQQLLELVLEHPEQNTREQLLEKVKELSADKD